MRAWADSLHLDKADSADLGLVYTAFWKGAVTADEVTLWLIDLKAERSPDKTPVWLRLALDEVSHPMELHKQLGFAPGDGTFDREDIQVALDGIAWIRGQQKGDPALRECAPRDIALACLRNTPDLIDWLARVIPQADLPHPETRG